MIVGHGVRERVIEGPLQPESEARLTGIATRRYVCRACDAVIVVAPRGVGRRFRYSLGAIAASLSLWAYESATAATTRSRMSAAKTIGAASATRWRSLQRWTRCALVLFGYAADALGAVRERAERIAVFVAAHAPISRGCVVADAFIGAAYCAPR